MQEQPIIKRIEELTRKMRDEGVFGIEAREVKLAKLKELGQELRRLKQRGLQIAFGHHNFDLYVAELAKDILLELAEDGSVYLYHFEADIEVVGNDPYGNGYSTKILHPGQRHCLVASMAERQEVVTATLRCSGSNELLKYVVRKGTERPISISVYGRREDHTSTLILLFGMKEHPLNWIIQPLRNLQNKLRAAFHPRDLSDSEWILH